MGDAIAIYSRKSKFTGKGESIENQIEMCKQYIQLHYGQNALDHTAVYEDEGFSGGTLNRPHFKKMMADAKKKKFSVIVVYRLDRISRNIGDFANLIEELNEMKIDFVSIKEQFDTSSPMGRAMMYISSVFSQLERETIAERIRDNMHELSKTGRWLGGITPTGYESEGVVKVNVDGKQKKAYRLKILPEEIEIVKLIYKMFLETNSLTKVDTYLLNHGYYTKNDRRFTRFSIRAILTNPVYMIADEDAYRYFENEKANIFSEECEFDGKHGVMAYNRTDQRSGKTNRVKPINEWVVSVGGHEGVIDGRTWVKVQSMLDINKSKSYRKPRSSVALLSGLLICGNCGDFMRPKLTTRVNSRGELLYVYKCTMKERSNGHQCNIKDCNGNELDRQVIQELKLQSESDSIYFKQLDRSNQSLTGDKSEYVKEIEQLKRNLADNESEIKGIVSVIGRTADTAAQEYLIAQIEELHAKNEKIKDRITNLNGIIATNDITGERFELLSQMLVHFRDTVDDMTVEQKRAAIRMFVKEIIWDGTNIHIVFFGSDYQHQFPKEPARKAIVQDNDGTVNFDEAGERSDVCPLGEDSKRGPDVLPQPEKAPGGDLLV